MDVRGSRVLVTGASDVDRSMQTNPVAPTMSRTPEPLYRGIAVRAEHGKTRG